VIQFKNDDAAYLAWVDTNPDGYVLNVSKKTDCPNLILHRASCASISQKTKTPGMYTARDFRKWCAMTIEELRIAAKFEGSPDRSFSNRCGMCRP